MTEVCKVCGKLEKPRYRDAVDAKVPYIHILRRHGGYCSWNCGRKTPNKSRICDTCWKEDAITPGMN